MEILFIIIAIALSVVAIMYATLRINELEQEIKMIHRESKKDSESQRRDIEQLNNNDVSIANSLGKWIEFVVKKSQEVDDDMYQLRDQIDEKVSGPMDYKNEVMKSAKAYIYMEMSYIRNQLKQNNTEALYEHLKQESAGDLYTKDLLAKGDMIDHE